ncbi:hypothetical protein U0070_017067 [Myodes glareolus]|uniref:Cell cycle control protein n=1 Tax=Myodes glareolus TaxID=447135 RepID=A0AAW0JJC2_MYOGA
MDPEDHGLCADTANVLEQYDCSKCPNRMSVAYSTKMEPMPQYDLSRLPENTALKQQTLPAHHLEFSASVVLSIFFATGGFCLCMGIILLLSAKSTKKIEINYTNICANCARLREDSSNFDKECTCSVPFYLMEKMENLYRYILSRSNSQLVGKDIWDVSNCAPFQVSHNNTPIVPCGAIANSIFNDTITLSYHLNSSIHIEVPMLKSGLTWWTDKYVKFRNPRTSDLARSAKPPHWARPIYELDTEDPGNNGFINEDFIVWMRTAAFPTFKKLYRRLRRVHYFVDGLPAGNYTFSISYSILLESKILPLTVELLLSAFAFHPDVCTTEKQTTVVQQSTRRQEILAPQQRGSGDFPVTVFRGEKSVVLSTLTWIGGGGLFLGLMYTVTGALTLVASFVILAIHLMLKKSKKDFL